MSTRFSSYTIQWTYWKYGVWRGREKSILKGVGQNEFWSVLIQHDLFFTSSEYLTLSDFLKTVTHTNKHSVWFWFIAFVWKHSSLCLQFNVLPVSSVVLCHQNLTILWRSYTFFICDNKLVYSINNIRTGRSPRFRSLSDSESIIVGIILLKVMERRSENVARAVGDWRLKVK
jgi:hypothetical protein